MSQDGESVLCNRFPSLALSLPCPFPSLGCAVLRGCAAHGLYRPTQERSQCRCGGPRRGAKRCWASLREWAFTFKKAVPTSLLTTSSAEALQSAAARCRRETVSQLSAPERAVDLCLQY